MLDQTRAMYVDRGLYLLFNLFILYLLYLLLIKDGKGDAIYKEFINHPLNTKKNIILCRLIWIALWLLPMVTAVILKGSMSLTSNSDFN